MSAPEAQAGSAGPTERSVAAAGATALDLDLEREFSAEHGVSRVRTNEIDRVLESLGVALPCSRPVRMRSVTGDVVEVRCGNRRKSQCPSCSALYSGDAAAILRSGALQVEPGAVIVMLTLTAPSFGAVHRAAKTSVSPRLSESAQLAWRKRAARSRCRCGQRHSEGDPQVGTALDPESYDFAGQVRWNGAAGRLWDRTSTRLRRDLGLDERLPYAGCCEWQARGSVHFHLLLRLPTMNGLGVHRDSSGRLRARAVETSVGTASTSIDREVFRWGTQVIAEVIAAPGLDEGRHAVRTIGYIRKALAYAAKDLASQYNSDESSHIEACEEQCRPGLVACPACERRLDEAEAAGSEVDQERLLSRCRSPRHRALGYGGHPLRKSRTWSSLTFGTCRATRREYASHGRSDRWLDLSCSRCGGLVSGGRFEFIGQGVCSDAAVIQRTLSGHTIEPLPPSRLVPEQAAFDLFSAPQDMQAAESARWARTAVTVLRRWVSPELGALLALGDVQLDDCTF